MHKLLNNFISVLMVGLLSLLFFLIISISLSFYFSCWDYTSYEYECLPRNDIGDFYATAMLLSALSIPFSLPAFYILSRRNTGLKEKFYEPGFVISILSIIVGIIYILIVFLLQL